MPNMEHKAPVALAELDPDLVAWLLTRLFDLKIPEYDHARVHPTDVGVTIPRTGHADGMVLFCDPSGRPLLAAALEVQRSRDPAKLRRWKVYVARLEAELKVSAALLVFCPEPAVERWYRDLAAPDEWSSALLRPLIFGPADVPLMADVELARAHPARVALSAICHGREAVADTVFPALAEALRALGPRRAVSYFDVVLAGLPGAARRRWEAFMTTTLGREYRSELLREVATQHEEVGEARGGAWSVVTVLEARGVPVPDGVRELVFACTDHAQLETWLRRATTATTVDDVVRP